MSKSLIPAQRRERIQKYMAIHKVARLADLSEMLNASDATVRRDLERLEKMGFLERTHGGAVLSQRLSREPEYQHRILSHPDEKLSIGQLAATLIEDGDIVFINSGTTTTEIIRHVRSNADITIITNNVFAVLETGKIGFNLILLGGAFHPVSNSVDGYFTIDSLKRVYADKTFIGVDGMSLKYGCTFPTSAEAEVVRMMMQRTRGPISVVADHSKWGTVSNFEIAKFDQIDRLITDKEFDASARAELAKRSVEVVINFVGHGA